MEKEYEGFDLRLILRQLRRRAGLIALCFVLVTGAALAFSLLRDGGQYEAQAWLLYGESEFSEFDQRIFGSPVSENPSPDPATGLNTSISLASLDVVARQTAKDLRGTGLGGRLIGEEISAVVTVGQSDPTASLLVVTATDPNRRRAVAIANAYSRNYVKFRRETDRASIIEARRSVERRYAELGPGERLSREGRALRTQIDNLKVLEAIQTGSAEIVQPARDAFQIPVGSSTARNAAAGAMLGLVLGVVLALLLERFDRRLKEPRDLEESFSLPLLA
jgi:capsular polysaccharide biosynthesis protein